MSWLSQKNVADLFIAYILKPCLIRNRLFFIYDSHVYLLIWSFPQFYVYLQKIFQLNASSFNSRSVWLWISRNSPEAYVCKSEIEGSSTDSHIIVEVSVVWPQVLGTIISTKYGFQILEWVLNPIRKLVHVPMMFMTLFQSLGNIPHPRPRGLKKKNWSQ